MKSLSSLCCKSIGENICVCRNTGTSSYRNETIIVCPRIMCYLLKWKVHSYTISQKGTLLFSSWSTRRFYRPRHFSHLWGFDDSSPNVRLHASSHDPHPTVTQTWSCSLPYTNYFGGVCRPPGSTWGSLTNICSMGLLSSFSSHRQKHECNVSVLFCSPGITGRESSF